MANSRRYCEVLKSMCIVISFFLDTIFFFVKERAFRRKNTSKVNDGFQMKDDFFSSAIHLYVYEGGGVKHNRNDTTRDFNSSQINTSEFCFRTMS